MSETSKLKSIGLVLERRKSLAIALNNPILEIGQLQWLS